MIDQGRDVEATTGGVRRKFLADILASNLKRKYRTTAKKRIFVDEISTSAGHKYFNCEY
jgi:hypothetical protein